MKKARKMDILSAIRGIGRREGPLKDQAFIARQDDQERQTGISEIERQLAVMSAVPNGDGQ